MSTDTKSLKLRFSLRTLLIAITIGSVLVVFVSRVNRQARLVAAITKSGGSFRYSQDRSTGSRIIYFFLGEESFIRIHYVTLRGTNADDKLVSRLATLRHLTNIDLSYTKTTDRGVSKISRLPLLQKLWLDGCPISDNSGTSLSHASELESLSLNATNISDRFLENLGQHLSVKYIGLKNTKVTSKGMDLVKRMPAIEYRSLYDKIIDDWQWNDL